jgi:hypothetical protein
MRSCFVVDASKRTSVLSARRSASATLSAHFPYGAAAAADPVAFASVTQNFPLGQVGKRSIGGPGGPEVLLIDFGSSGCQKGTLAAADATAVLVDVTAVAVCVDVVTAVVVVVVVAVAVTSAVAVAVDVVSGVVPPSLLAQPERMPPVSPIAAR